MSGREECRVAFMWDDSFEQFDNGVNHPVRRGRFRAVRDYLWDQGLLGNGHTLEIRAEPLPEELLRIIHTTDYIQMVRRISETGVGDLDIDTPGFVGIYDTARSLCGGTTTGVDAILNGEIDHFVSPTGGFHHAFPDHGGGFCVFNDIAASVCLLQSRGVNRVLIVDLDVHHGNGIQHYFYDCSDVMYVSIHEDPEWMYPHSGRVEEWGSGEGIGYTVNVPLPMDTGDSGYQYAFDQVVSPLVEFFQPEFIFLLPGFDTHFLDPLAHMVTTTRTIRYTTTKIHAAAHKFSDGRLAVVSGGGYHKDALRWGVATVISVLAKLPYSPPEESPSLTEDRETWDEIRSAVETVRKTVFAILGL
ncbi:MAG: histone deacetylase family protein [Candidatus Thorarchaeota archaeon]